MMTTDTAAKGADVFAGHDSVAAIMGFIHHSSGDEGLVQLVATIEDPIGNPLSDTLWK